jgi:lipoprotein-anchoring transpeptidase ErfK/SrfK
VRRVWRGIAAGRRRGGSPPVAAALALATLALAGCGAGAETRSSAGPPAGAETLPREVDRAPEEVLPAEGPLRRLGGEITRRVQLRAAPDGRVVRTLGLRTELRGAQTLAIVARRGRWYGVLHPSMPNGRAGWIPVDAVRLLRVPWEIVIDRSAHRLRVLRHGRVVDAFPVAVGRPGSRTPPGRFAVTDRLRSAPGSPYGCCILALTGRQPNLPVGWSGGDRLALHGTPTEEVGAALSSGCIRIRTPDLRRLMRRIPVGTRVTVRA